MSIDILHLAKEAQKKKEKNPKVINATVGMYYDEDGFIGGMPSVFKGLRNLDEEHMLPYPAVDGGEPFKSNVISWVLGSYEAKLRKNLYMAACATPGGGGAIAGTLAVYANPQDYIFVSNIRWQYDRYADRAHLRLFEHNTFIDGHFDLESFEQKLYELSQTQKQIIVIVNDPCHNPTGYTLSIDEWKELLIILNKFVKNDIVFLYDLAYLEYTSEEDSRLKISYLDVLNAHVLTMITFSGSKTFGVYGVRLGAAIALSKDETKIIHFKKAFSNEARGSWSTTPTPAIELLNHFSQKQYQPEFFKDLNQMKQVIQKRCSIFSEQAKEIGLKTHPFKSGFYTIVLADDEEKAFKQLLAHDIYTIPMSGGIRIALCSLPIKEVDGLAQRIQKILLT
jgi:aspartate/tyrosine/aromatic aminotransferase